MVETLLQIIEIPSDSENGVVQHLIQGVGINDNDISRVLFYEGHDVIVGTSSYEHSQVYCLKNYKGNLPNIPLHSAYLSEYNDDQLHDLSERSDGKLPFEKLAVVRDIVKELEQQNQINRIEPKCSRCMWLDFGIAHGLIQP